MKIAYCIHYLGKSFDELSENVDQLIDQGDDVFVMINDDDLRDQMVITYADDPALHVSQIQQQALHGDLSLPRGQIVQLRNALDAQINEKKSYDRFILLTDGMLPLKSKEEIVCYLDQYPDQDIYYIKATSQEDPSLKKRFENYAFFTNTLSFQKSKMVKGMNTITSKLVHNFKKREIEDTLVLSYPWFILTEKSARALGDAFPYCSNPFKMCLYPEELAIATMLRKFSDVKHHNESVWVVGKNGEYQFQEPIEPLSEEALRSHPKALFGATIHPETNLSIYQDYFDAYSINQ